ncbi:hypothetical protein [Aliivibrio fischeri]|uniref:hypothetical protein n=1 Tax=Aliivibrio fischeri TaxID=668 RepID=UPI0007C4F016|nr:hypothetical protein [Aliivibrio fischeri]
MSKYYLLTLSLTCSTSVPAYCLFLGNDDNEAKLANIITTAYFVNSTYDNESGQFNILNSTDTIEPYGHLEISAEYYEILRSTLSLCTYNGLDELTTLQFNYDDVEQYISETEPALTPLFIAHFTD